MLRPVVITLLLAASPFALASAAMTQAPTDANSSAASSPAPATTQNVSPAIGSVDIGKIVPQYPLFVELNAAIEKQVAERMQQMKALDQQLDELAGTIKVLDDPQERAGREFELNVGRQRREFLVKSFNQRTQIEQERMLLRVYQDIDAAIAKVAQKRGLVLIVRHQEIAPSTTPIADLKVREVALRVQTYENRRVWYAAKELDITADVVKLLQIPQEPKDGKE